MAKKKKQAPAKKKKKLVYSRYRFDIHDSDTTPLGCVGWLIATSREEALAKLKAGFEEHFSELRLFDDLKDPKDLAICEDMEYMHVYLNHEYLSLANITEEEELDEEQLAEYLQGKQFVPESY